MKYYDDMQSKDGFSDGDTMPDGITTYRQVYIRVLNALLAQYGSMCRVAAYNRSGFHNWCLIVRITPEEYAILPQEAIERDVSEASTLQEGEPAADNAYIHAVHMAYELDLDSYVNIQVSLYANDLDDMMVNVLPTLAKDDAP